MNEKLVPAATQNAMYSTAFSIRKEYVVLPPAAAQTTAFARKTVSFAMGRAWSVL